MQQDLIEKSISNLVETQFPEFFRTDGPMFVKFVQKYYEWMEGEQEVAIPMFRGCVSYSAKNPIVMGHNTFFLTDFAAGDSIALYEDETETSYEIFVVASVESNTSLTLNALKLPTRSSTEAYYGHTEIMKNVLYHARRLPDYDDIDLTTDEFVLYFKETFLKNIQFTTKTNTRQLVKHALDIYRSKGTPRAIDLLFRIVFGVGASVYYPRDDLFRSSDGEWYVPTYLEVSMTDKTIGFVNKQIIGLTSRATAFVESVIRRTVKGKLVDIVYISAVNGNFKTGELINTSSGTGDNTDAPVITGSLNDIVLPAIGTSYNYKVGDIVNLWSGEGEQAQGRIKTVSTITGIITYTLVDGGYGYTANAQIIASDQVMLLSNIGVQSTAISSGNTYFDRFETVYQPSALITYTNANNSFAADIDISSYYANGFLAGNCHIMGVTSTNSTAGSLVVSPRSGNLNVSYLGTSGNTTTANIATYADTTATGNAIGYSINATAFKLGVKTLTNSFYALAGNRIYGNTFLTNGAVTAIGSGSGASFKIANTLSYLETVSINSDLLSPYLNVRLNANAYGFPAAPTANMSSIIGPCLSYTSYTIGKITSLVKINPGINYNLSPIFLVYEPNVAAYNLSDQYKLYLTGITGIFTPGELVTQVGANSRGLVISSTDTSTIVQNLRFANPFLLTTNSTLTVVGEATGYSANITAIEDTHTTVIGADANITDTVSAGVGAVTKIEVIDSGFGFVNSEDVFFDNGVNVTGAGKASLSRQGTSIGRYKQKGGFTSDDKKIFDGLYYQHYSYDIRSSLALDKYENMLKQLLHIPGMKYFGSFIHNSINDAVINSKPSKITLG